MNGKEYHFGKNMSDIKDDNLPFKMRKNTKCRMGMDILLDKISWIKVNFFEPYVLDVILDIFWELT